MKNGTAIARWPIRRLLREYAGVMAELRERKVMRSANSPVSDYAEWLAARALGLDLVHLSTTGYDALDRRTGKRYEIKARRTAPGSKPTMLSAIRGLGEKHFDYLLVVLFDAGFMVKRAALIPHRLVQEVAVYRKHVNAHIVLLRDALWERPEVKDVTRRFVTAQREEERTASLR